MCGFVGVYQLDKQKVELNKLIHMRDSIIHRGPDDEGLYCDDNIGLGFRRLSIIDIQSGHQPMSTVDDRYTIVFNGEIYNYVELREGLIKKGAKFQTHSDTEVILQLFAEKGPECLQLLNGMFAFAIWDKVKRELFFARDRLGIKPFYYYHDEDRFVFGSEIKAIIADSSIKREPNYAAIYDYLSFMYVPDNKTFFKGIYKLLPGYYGTISEASGLHIEQYWDVEFKETNKTEEEYISSLRDLIEDAVKIHLRSDVPVGCHLSGGLDSSTVTVLSAQNLDQKIKTFSGKFAENEFYDETKYAKLVAKQAGTEYLETVPNQAWFENVLPKIIWHMDEPCVGPGIVPQYSVCQLASESVKVALGGQGGDEIFGGYPRYFLTYEAFMKNNKDDSPIKHTQKTKMARIMNKLVFIKGYAKQHGIKTTVRKVFTTIQRDREQNSDNFNDIWRNYSTSFKFKDMALLTERFHSLVDDYDSSKVFNQYIDQCPSADIVNKMLYHDMKAYLPGLLQVEDRMSMAVSLESRVPLLDYRIVEFAASIPSSIKVKGLEPKYIFKRAIQGIIPDEVLNRKDKKGFPTPINIWFKRDPQFVKAILLDGAAQKRNLFKVETIEKMIASNEDYSWQLWTLMNVELWFKIFIDQDPRYVNADGSIKEKVEN
ncbi:asparagine synthase (glutamine-hydrolyzing) [Schinkia azotoformans]|uniref:asparagine synthase (glutamine-hydrolyzing) n=1 Tax=Schinkia azotoformans TaxID=1454 RepID=UPI002DB6CDE7|nr:asparagine synthase (glutamine-hydrolyzing) [Schinkia azotoformans]MEC1714819.1 asparagine synthase (glutamine-hydrolyzing) [Schinkia azotoformans]MEC1741725.1 asparagine synthase (glutamine-hydrolyzing) [Schinkia azotoformans]MEC1766597.1 asparagine synthase (glutamine-hydrolyzing) [Schinkia azotoformans]MEC1788012.1 asparagine synthase (glutamine-hydrolyzing) [Schinkia azotoformans]MED4375422.1 asparagine synthase (glutamine-hydrolyzing) [Schinkia azotoformans]